MTGTRSALNYVWPYAIFIFFIVFVAEHTFGTIPMALFLAFLAYKDYRRRSTLRQRDDGTYVWIEWHGGESSSCDDPTAPGGEWDSDGDGDGGD